MRVSKLCCVSQSTLVRCAKGCINYNSLIPTTFYICLVNWKSCFFSQECSLLCLDEMKTIQTGKNAIFLHQCKNYEMRFSSPKQKLQIRFMIILKMMRKGTFRFIFKSSIVIHVVPSGSIKIFSTFKNKIFVAINAIAIY